MKQRTAVLKNFGISRDPSVSKTDANFVWENVNIRLTASDDDTLLSATNERGTIMLAECKYGTLIGWNVLDSHLILFFAGTTDYIVRYDFVENNGVLSATPATVFSGNLGFSTTNPIESVVSYESEDVQKIYWVDGLHVLRSCNFMASYVGRSADVFDSNKGTETQLSITTVKDNGGATRPNGTVQYFVTAYNKLGVETGIVAESSLVYLSPMDRGGAADETNSNRIIINLAGTYSCGFDYIRLYGVLRTSQNGQTTAYIISEVPVAVSSSDVVTIVDNGTNYLGTTDASVLLFLGSKEVVPSTMAQKDNTLFLGNLDVKSNDYDTLDDLATACRNSSTGLSTVVDFDDYRKISIEKASDSYPYTSQLNLESNCMKVFKTNEKYRFAVVFKKPNGDRSKAFWIGDAVCDEYPTMTDGNIRYCIPHAYLPKSMTNEAARLGYKYAQLHMAQATYADRSVKAQGFLNPTVFNLWDRYNNQPYARPSWMARPNLGNVEFMHIASLHNANTKSAEIQSNSWEGNQPKAYYAKDDDGVINMYVPEAWAERPQQAEELTGSTGAGFVLYMAYKKTSASEVTVSRAYVMIYKTSVASVPETIDGYNPDPLWEFVRTVDICSASRFKYSWTEFSAYAQETCEDDGILRLYYNLNDSALASIKSSLSDGTNRTPVVCNTAVVLTEGAVITDLTSAGTFCQYSRQHYFIDANIVTFHSPEIEYEQINVDRNTGLKLRIVGAAQISASSTDSEAQVTDSDYVGNNIMKYDYSTPNMSSSVGTLTAAPMYYDSVTTDNTEDETVAIEPVKGYYMTYLWHKSGSIINYTNGAGKSFANIATKRFANRQFSYYSHYVATAQNYTPKCIRQISGSSSGIYEIDTVDGTKSYSVNVPATVMTPPSFKYPIYRSQSASGTYDSAMSVIATTRADSAVMVTYNSRPHLVISLPSSSSSTAINSMTVLPSRRSSNGSDVFDLNETYAVNYLSVLSKWSYSSGNAIVYLKITDYARDSSESSLYSALRGTLSIVTNSGYYLAAAAIRSADGQVRQALDSTEFTTNSITLSTHSSMNVLGNILALTFIMTKNVYEDGVYLYRSSLPVNIYGESSKLYAGWSDKTISDTSISQASVTVDSFTDANAPYLWIAELYEDYGTNDTRYGGVSASAVQNNVFIPCGPDTLMTERVPGYEGDAYFQRYDCLVGYPQSANDRNQLIDIASVMLETHVNLDGRTDKDRGVSQLANIDYTQFGAVNMVYSQGNNFLPSRVFDETTNQGKYPTTVTWSKEKHPLETNDTWMNVTLASTLTMDPSFGPLSAIRSYKNTLVAFQNKGISELLFNPRVQMSASDGVPIEIANSGKMEGKRTISNHYGCLNKWSVIEGRNGLYFKDDLSKEILRFDGQSIEPLSSKARLDVWVRNHSYNFVWDPVSNGNTVSFFDRNESEVYFVNPAADADDIAPTIVYNEKLGAFTSFYSYAGVPFMANVLGRLVAYKNSYLWRMHEGFYNTFFGEYQPSSITWRICPEPYGDKIWTNIEYRTDFIEVLDGVGATFKYDEGEATAGTDGYMKDITFDTMKVWNEYQNTGSIDMSYTGTTSLKSTTGADTRKKFRIWRADIPRDPDSAYKMDRIRNPWIYLKLTKNYSDAIDRIRMEMHDLLVKYYSYE